MAGLSKITIERNHRTLLELVSQPGNDVCADCKARHPRWASYNLGIFVCVNCASIHRKIGTHITKIKSITMDAWTKEQLEVMKSIGNVKSNALYNPNEARNPPPANLMDAERDSELEQYIRSKYQFKRFIDKSTLVAPKPGARLPTSVIPNGGHSDSSSRAPSAPLTSTVSSPSMPTYARQTTAPRRSTLSTTVPTQAVSQPSTPQYPHQPQAQAQIQPSGTSSTNGGVWNDLISLQTPSSSSSLPLQFQTPSQPSLTPQGYQTSMVTGINPFQQQHLASNPYSQPTPGLPGPSLASGALFPTSTALGGGLQQQSFFSAQQTPGPMSAPAVQAQSNFYQPQPQQALQGQLPGAGQALFAAGNGQSVMSASAIQGHFLSTSPAQFPSDSPVSTTPQPHMFSTTPQPQMFSTNIQPEVQPQAASQMMFMPLTTPSQQFQIQQQGGLGVGSLQAQAQSQTSMPVIVGQTPFGAAPQVQSQMMAIQSGHFGGAFQQSFPASGFSGGQQWGGPM